MAVHLLWRKKRLFVLLVILCAVGLWWMSGGAPTLPILAASRHPTSAVKCKSEVLLEANWTRKDLHQQAELLSQRPTKELEEMYYSLFHTTQFTCQHQVHMGPSNDFGWQLCLTNQFTVGKPCFIYSFGVGKDMSFEHDAEDMLKCEIHTFDPSLGLEDHKVSKLVWFHNLGIDGSNRVQHSWNMKTLETIMRDLHHRDKVLDLLKIDVEFSEWLALPQMLQSGVLKRQVRQLIMEVHTPEMDIHHYPESSCTWTNSRTLAHMLVTLQELERQGFRLFFVDTNYRTKFASRTTWTQRYCCFQVYFINMQFVK